MEEHKTLSRLRAKMNRAVNELRGRPYLKGFRLPRRSKCAVSSSVRGASKQARIDEGRQRLRWHRFQKWFESAAKGEAPDTCFETRVCFTAVPSCGFSCLKIERVSILCIIVVTRKVAMAEATARSMQSSLPSIDGAR